MSKNCVWAVVTLTNICLYPTALNVPWKCYFGYLSWEKNLGICCVVVDGKNNLDVTSEVHQDFFSVLGSITP